MTLFIIIKNKMLKPLVTLVLADVIVIQFTEICVIYVCLFSSIIAYTPILAFSRLVGRAAQRVSFAVPIL